MEARRAIGLKAFLVLATFELLLAEGMTETIGLIREPAVTWFKVGVGVASVLALVILTWTLVMIEGLNTEDRERYVTLERKMYGDPRRWVDAKGLEKLTAAWQSTASVAAGVLLAVGNIMLALMLKS